MKCPVAWLGARVVAWSNAHSSVLSVIVKREQRMSGEKEKERWVGVRESLRKTGYYRWFNGDAALAAIGHKNKGTNVA